MTSTVLERNLRRSLALVRLMPAYMPLPLANWLIRQGLTGARLHAEVRRESVSADGVACEWLIPAGSPTDSALLYLHGGGFIYGLTPQHIEMVSHLAHKTGMRALMVDYRLGPEHPFPAALEDCLTAYRWLIKQGILARGMAVAGDSAGGNLTITMMMKLRDEGGQLPAAAACLSPVINLTERSEAFTKFHDPLLHPRAVRIFSRSYCADHDPLNPYISPVFGDLRGLPPLLIHAGEDEVLREDAVGLEGMAKAAGVEVRLEIYPRMWHVWQIFLSLPQAVQSLDNIAGFFRAHLGLVEAYPSR